MPEQDLPRPTVTVATIVERDGRFLLVEEETRYGNRFNQPAGHLEIGETLPAGAVRETLEETAWHIGITALVGIYRWEVPDTRATFIRFAFAADTKGRDETRGLDIGIVRAVWMTYEEVAACKDAHRSPLVLRCIDDYRAGKRWPLSFVTEIA